MRKPFFFLLLAAIPVVAQPPRGPQPRPVLLTIDADHDGTLSEAEILAAPQILPALDLNHDGQLTADEYLPRPAGLGASPDELVSRLMVFDKNGDGVLTSDEVPERMQNLFQRGDRNHDGKLTSDEIKAMAGRQGMPNGKATAPGTATGMVRMDPILNAIDANHDGVLSAEEIRHSAEALKVLDANHDGKLTPDEFKVREQTPQERVEHMLGEWDTNKDGKIAKAEAPDQMQQRFDTMDLNHDGFLTQDELLTFFSNPQNMQQQRRGPRPEGQENK